MVGYGSLVKRLRRRPLTAETGVRFPYELFSTICEPYTDKEASGIAEANLGVF